MSLVLLIILGGFLLLRVSSSKGARIEANIEFQGWLDDKSAWISRVTNLEVEAEVRNQAGRSVEADEVYETIFTPEELRQERWLTVNSKNSLRILMAKRGYLLKEDAKDATSSWGIGTNGSVMTEKTLKWCACELEKHGVYGLGPIKHGVYGISSERLAGEKEREYHQWIFRVTDKALESELRSLIDNNIRKPSKREHPANIFCLLSEKFKSRYADISDILKLCKSWNEILLVVMAKQGKLPFEIAKKGILYTPNSKWSTDISLIRWLDQELQRHGLEPMLFKEFRTRLEKTDIAADKTISRTGHYCWWSGRLYVL